MPEKSQFVHDEVRLDISEAENPASFRPSHDVIIELAESSVAGKDAQMSVCVFYTASEHAFGTPQPGLCGIWQFPERPQVLTSLTLEASHHYNITNLPAKSIVKLLV